MVGEASPMVHTGCSLWVNESKVDGVLEADRLELARFVFLIMTGLLGGWNMKLFFALGLAGEEQVVAMEGRFMVLLILMVEFARSDCTPRFLRRVGLVGGVPPLPDLFKAMTAWGQLVACMLLAGYDSLASGKLFTDFSAAK